MEKQVFYGLTQVGDIQPKPVYVDQNRRLGVTIDSSNIIKITYPVEISIDQVQTSSVGTSYVDLPAGACSMVEVVNVTGVSIEYRRNGVGLGFPIPTGSSKVITGITNSSQISVRRQDTLNTPVTINFSRYE